MNLDNLQNTLKILYGLKTSDNFTLEAKTAKNGNNYILIKKNLKGKDYIENQERAANSANLGFKYKFKGNTFDHGMLIWFNEHNCKINMITCRTFKSTKGFSHKEYKKLMNDFYEGDYYELNRKEARLEEKGLDKPHVKYIKDKLNPVPWKCKFKIEAPTIVNKKCKNKKTQILHFPQKNKYTMKACCTIDNDYLDKILTEKFYHIVQDIEISRILSKVFSKKMDAYVKTLEPRNTKRRKK